MKIRVLLFFVLCAVLGLTTANALVVVLQRPTGQLISGATSGGVVVPVEVDADGKINVTDATIDADLDSIYTEILTLSGTVDEIKTTLENPAPLATIPVGGVMIQGSILTAMTLTSSTEVTVGVALNYQYITNCSCSNASTTVSTDILLQDGISGTPLGVIACPAGTVAGTGGNGGSYSFLRQVPTVGNGLWAENVTTGASTKIMCNGWRSTTDYGN